jgi:phosphate transport system substrate-binding protein
MIETTMRKFLLPFACLFAATTVMADVADSPTLSVAGSDLLGSTLAEPLEKYAAEAGETLSLEMLGSLPGLSALRDGYADVALVAIPQGEALPEDRYKLYPFAYQVAVLVVNAENPVSEISLRELDRIYSAESRERIERWGQLGLTGQIAGRSIQMYAIASDNSVVVELFKYRALGEQSLRANVNIVTTNRRILEQISGDLGAIGVTNQLPEGRLVKAIPISTGDVGSFSFGPSPENVYYGDYPLALPFYIAVSKEGSRDFRPFIRFMLSQEVASELSKAGFMPLAENIRKRMLSELDM